VGVYGPTDDAVLSYAKPTIEYPTPNANSRARKTASRLPRRRGTPEWRRDLAERPFLGSPDR